MPPPASSEQVRPGSPRPRCSGPRGSTSTASRWARGSAATGATRTTTASARRTARCTSTPPARRWSTPRGRCRRACRTIRATGRSRQYFDDFVDHFGLRDAITFRTEVTKVTPADGGGWDVTIRPRDDARAVETRHYDHVLVANGHHWDPRWPEPSFPGSENVPGRADPRALLPHAGGPRRQARGGAGDRQLGDRHRGRGVAARPRDLPGDAARGVGAAEVPVRHADRPPHRLTARPGTAAAPEARACARCCGSRSAR